MKTPESSKIIRLPVLLIGLALLWLPLVTLAQQSTAPKRVLVLYWYDKGFPGHVVWDQSFQATLKSVPGAVDYYPEYLEANRFPGENQSQILHDFLLKKYAELSIDVVVAQSDASLNFLLKYRDDLFPKTPIVFYAGSRPTSITPEGRPYVTGVIVISSYKKTLDLALSLNPQVNQVFIISGSLERDKRFEVMAREELQGFESRVRINYLTDLSPEELIAKTSILPQRSLVLYAWQQARNNQGKLLESVDILDSITRNIPVPVFGMSGPLVGHGIIGGHVYTPEAGAARVAEMVGRIASGERAQDIPVENAPTVPMFDSRELRRWGIDESKLPTGSIIRNKELSVWELYKWRIIGVIALVVLQALGIAWLLFTQAKRRQAENRSARFAVLAQSEHQHLDEIVANVPGIIWESRLEGNDPLPKTTFLSPYLKKMLGFTPGEWVSKPGFWRSVVVEEDREQVEATIARVLETGEDGIVQARFRTKDGPALWGEAHLTAIRDENGKPVGLRGVTMNISDRRRAEAALEKNQAQLAGIIGSAMDAIISIDEQQRVILFNAAAETMFGYSVSEAIDQPLNLFIPSPLPDEHRDRHSPLKKRNGQVLYVGSFASLTGRRAGGEEFPIDVSISEVELNGARFYTIILREITERLRAEAALRERQQELSEAQRVAKVGSWEWDPANDIVTWSEELYQIMGRNPAPPAPSYKEHPSLYIPESWERLKCAVEKCLQDGVPYELELEVIRSDGSRRWTNARGEVIRDANGKIIKLRGTLQDIAERKQAEAALQAAMEEVSKLKNQLEEENIYLREEIKLAHNVDEIIGRSNGIKYVLFKIEQVGQTESTVMILGETGTGKELVARAIHAQSRRNDRPLVKVNCAALSASLIESELFGHEKGSFTGALARKFGRFELADCATLFLDEIGELPLEVQAKLLRVIQEGEFERLGSSKTTKVDVRIIAATNRNMKEEVAKGAFREDLWYRLNVFPITVPPLRQRKEDIPPMVEHFVNSFSRKVGKRITAVSSATLKKLEDYSWPGNVRELANVIERAVITAQGSVLHIADRFEQPPAQQPAGASRTLDEIEKEYITRILDDTAWRIEGPNGAARILGLNPSTLRTRMVKLGIQKSVHSSAQA